MAVLFADMVGYTRLSAELAPRSSSPHGSGVEALDGVIEMYGGTVDKHIGDCVMGVFGAPLAHGDDAERAARAALDIHSAAAQLDASVGRGVAFRVGVASGSVVASGTGEAGARAYTVPDGPSTSPRA